VVASEEEWALAVTVPLAERGDGVRALLKGDEVRYYVARDGELQSAQSSEKRVDRGVYLLLAELAGRE
jgi:hypothetical protein